MAPDCRRSRTLGSRVIPAIFGHPRICLPVGQNVQVAEAGPFEPERARWYTDDDRRDQLCRLAEACRELADLLEHRESGTAGVYRAAAQTADALRAQSLDQTVLSVVGQSMPPPPVWLLPKPPEFDGPWDDWHHAVAEARHEADRAALELRSLATYDV